MTQQLCPASVIQVKHTINSWKKNQSHGKQSIFYTHSSSCFAWRSHQTLDSPGALKNHLDVCDTFLS